MKKFLKNFQDSTGNLFSSQDSKYFIATAFKMTAVPFFAFMVVGYSIWNLMELNFNFFVANGFQSGEGFKDTFYDAIFGEISNFVPIFTVSFGVVFLIGLGVAFLALRPFGHIEKHIRRLEEDPEAELIVQGMNKNKLVYQVSRIFFKYLQVYRAKGQTPRIRLPENLTNLNSPRVDKVFLFKYAMVITGLCLLTSVLLFSFTTEFYEQIVNNSNNLLDGDITVTSFITAEIDLLEKIRSLAIFGIIFGYVAISFNIIKSVDGVSYGFSRDMLRIMDGEHDVKLRPRYADPGKSMAHSINDYLEDLFPAEDEHAAEFDYNSTDAKIKVDQEFHQTPEEVVKNDLRPDQESFHQDVQKDGENFDWHEDGDEPTLTDFHAHQLHEQQEPEDQFHDEDQHIEEHQPTEETQPMVSQSVAEEFEDEELPPAFIQEKPGMNGDKVFQITTPTGKKMDNLSEDMVIKLVLELENQKKAS